MLKLKYQLMCVLLVTAFPFIILMFLFEDANGETNNGSFRIYSEMRISSTDMDCNYVQEAYKRIDFDFEYPKLLIGEEELPVVAFIDEKSQNLIFAEIDGRSIRITNRLPSFGESLWWFKWPTIFVRNNKIHLSVIDNGSAGKRQYRIRVFTLDKKSGSLNLYKEVSLTNGKIFNELNSRSSAVLSGIYPYGQDGDNFFIHGQFSKVHFHILGLISGHFPTFDKNFSINWKGNEIDQFGAIDEKGEFGAEHRVYTVSDSEIATAAWIRRWHNISSQHDESICFSQKTGEAKWTKPLELYAVKNTVSVYHLRNLSITNYNNSVYLLWQDIEKGFYFAEIKDGLQREITRISDMKKPSEKQEYNEPLWGALTTKLTTDHNGNVYVLWVLNADRKYQTFFKARFNGKWTETIVVNSGAGVVKLPDMKVDSKGFVHITYVKGVMENIACYYTKLKYNP